MYSPTGETVGLELDSGDTRVLTLTQAGTYVIQVYDNDYTHTQTELINRGKAPEYTVHLQDAQPPFIQSVTVSDPLLTDLDAGPANFAVTVVFSETLDPATVPTLVYGNSAVTGGLTPTLSNPSIHWSASTVTDDTLTITYDVADRGLNAENITIGVTGAKDLTGNLQQSYNPEPEFSIDTLNPVVIEFTPRDNATRVAPAVNLVMAFGEFIREGRRLDSAQAVERRRGRRDHPRGERSGDRLRSDRDDRSCCTVAGKHGLLRRSLRRCVSGSGGE